MLSLDNNFEVAKKFAAAQGLQVPVYYPAEKLPDLFNTDGIPATFIFNEKGDLVKQNNGADDYGTNEYIKLVNSTVRQCALRLSFGSLFCHSSPVIVSTPNAWYTGHEPKVLVTVNIAANASNPIPAKPLTLPVMKAATIPAANVGRIILSPNPIFFSNFMV